MFKKISLALATVVALSACNKKTEAPKTDKPAVAETKPAETKPTEPTSTAATQTVAAPVAGEIAELSKYAPAATDVVVSVNFGSIKQGPLWQKYSPLLDEALKGEDMKKFTEAGIDPKAAEGIFLALGGFAGEEKPKGMIIVKIAHDDAKLSAAFEKEGMTKETVEGKTVYLDKKDDSGPGNAIVLLDANHIMTGDLAEVKEALANGAKGTFAGNADLGAMLGNLDASKSIVAAVNLSAKMKEDLMKSFPPDFASPKGALFALDLSKGVDMKLTLPFASAEEATKVKGVAEIGMAEPKKQAEAMGFGDFVKSFALTTADKDFVATWVLSSDETLKLAEKVAGMMGAMGGAPMPEAPVAPEAPKPE